MDHTSNSGSYTQEQVDRFVAKQPYETASMIADRKRVFFRVLRATNDINQAIVLANIHNNMKYLRCKYPAGLTQQLERFMSGGAQG